MFAKGAIKWEFGYSLKNWKNCGDWRSEMEYRRPKC